MANIDAQAVKTAAQGNWLNILVDIAPVLKDAVEKKPGHVPCPVNGGKDGFRLFEDAPYTGAGYSNKEGAFGDGFAVLQFVTGLPFKEVLELVANKLGMSDTAPLYIKPKAIKRPPKTYEISEQEALTRKGKLNRFWGQTSVLREDDRVIRYLRSRGIKGDWVYKIPTIHLHPNAWYRDASGNQASAPAMALKFQSKDGTPCNIHKTFLSSKTDGKLEIDDPKLLMKPSCKMSGGAVRLGGIEHIVKHNGMLHIAEGFENAATMADIFRQPSWATLNWALLQGFMPPQEVKTLVIWADNDPLDEKGNNPGVKAAEKLRGKLANLRPDIKVILKIPPKKKEDWNDLYQDGRMDLFSLELE